MKRQTYDVVIVGGGIMGSACAYFLKNLQPAIKVAVIERDPTYEKSSTTLSLANVRVQFSLEENIRISQYTIKFLKGFSELMAVDDHHPEVSFKQEGNLFIFAGDEEEEARKSLQLQHALGCDTEWLHPGKIHSSYPSFRINGFAGGIFGSNDGHLDAYTFLNSFKTKAIALGVEFVEGEVLQITCENDVVRGVTLENNHLIVAGKVVNCAGAWAAEIAATAGINIPVIPVNRQVFAFKCNLRLNKPYPLVNLPSGLYFRSEAKGMFLAGRSLAQDKVGYDFRIDFDRFDRVLWPELAAFAPAFDQLKLIRGWAGLYAVNTFDGNAILGEWPERKGLFLANGFSGHGLQQAPAVGRYLSELILGLKPSLDLSIFSSQRLLENKPIKEDLLV